MEFTKYSKTPRFTKNIVITEKTDGTNAQLIFDEERNELRAGSRNRHVVVGDDNFGFASWLEENREILTKYFGHFNYPIYGEWWGRGIQRGYGRNDKYFSIFRTGLFGKEMPEELTNIGVQYVPILYEGPNLRDIIWDRFHHLKEFGSKAVPGYDDPEGICIFFKETNTVYKMTYEFEKGKWND